MLRAGWNVLSLSETEHKPWDSPAMRMRTLNSFMGDPVSLAIVSRQTQLPADEGGLSLRAWIDFTPLVNR